MRPLAGKGITQDNIAAVNHLVRGIHVSHRHSADPGRSVQLLRLVWRQQGTCVFLDLARLPGGQLGHERERLGIGVGHEQRPVIDQLPALVDRLGVVVALALHEEQVPLAHVVGQQPGLALQAGVSRVAELAVRGELQRQPRGPPAGEHDMIAGHRLQVGDVSVGDDRDLGGERAVEVAPGDRPAVVMAPVGIHQVPVAHVMALDLGGVNARAQRDAEPFEPFHVTAADAERTAA